MVYLINNDKKILFCIFPKSNCTIISKIFYDYIGLTEEWEKYSNWVHDYSDNIYIKLNKFENWNKYKDYLKLVFIRNPYDRAISGYIHYCKYNIINKNISFYQFINKYEEF